MNRASSHFKLQDNEEVKSFTKIVQAQKASEEKAAYDRAMPPQEVMAKMIEEAKGLGTPEKKADGTLTFNFFLETSKIVTRYTLQQTKTGLEEHAVSRRQAIKDNNEQRFQELILETSNWEQLTHTLI